MSQPKNKVDLMNDAFAALNNFKRHRAMHESKPDERSYHELKMYKMIDQLELTMRGVNRQLKDEMDAS